MRRPILVTVQWFPCAKFNTHAAKALRRVLRILGLTRGISVFNIVIAFIASTVICFWRNN